MTLCDGVAVRRWLSEIGDPGIIPWVAIFIYAMASVAGIRAAQREAPGWQRTLWTAIALGMLALAVNKQLDIQTLVLRCGGEAARSGGWRSYRRVVELLVALALAGVAIGLSARLAMAARQMDNGIRLALVGVALIALFLISRGSGILHVPLLRRAMPPPVRPWIEIAGATITLLGAWLAARRPLPTPRQDRADRR